MHYNINFEDAVIKRERFPQLLGHFPAKLHDPAAHDQRALDAVNALLGDSCEATQDAETGAIDLSGTGYWDSAGYGYGDDLKQLLLLCEPGAYIHEIDAEECSGDQWRHVVLEDRTLVTISPNLTWPEPSTVTA